MRQMVQWAGRSAESVLVLAAGLWCAGTIGFHLDGAARWLALCAVVVSVLWLLIALWRGSERAHVWSGLVFLLVLLAVSMGWNRIRPSQDRHWADDVARRLQVSSFDGRHVVLDNVRNFDWRGEADYDVAWETRQYDLDQLRSADLFLSYWMGPAIAHTLVSFGFADGRQLVFSLEIRKEQDEQFDALAGFFRRYEMILVASEERDIIRVRSNVRGEQVDVYRIAALKPPALRQLFIAYLDQAQALDKAPAFYNTLTSNCTTIVWELARTIAPALPLDWRLLASGYLADYVHDLGGLTPGYSLAQLQEAARITERAAAADQADDFPQRIRQGVPGMDQEDQQ